MSKPSYPNLAILLDSWILQLRSERKTQATLKTYEKSVRVFLSWCESKGHEPQLTRELYNSFTVDSLDMGQSPATVKTRQQPVRRFSAWLAEEQEIPADLLANVKPVKVDTLALEPLTETEIKALLKACAGNSFECRRDEALIRFMVETGIRSAECLNLGMDDLNLIEGLAHIRIGKGGKGRLVPFGAQTARALDRYRRSRTQHKLADTNEFWLGGKNRGFGYNAFYKALMVRANIAGIDRFHPHLLRHTAAHRWLVAGGSEGGLMAVAGWSRPDMLQRYTKARASERAAAEARNLNLGDL